MYIYGIIPFQPVASHDPTNQADGLACSQRQCSHGNEHTESPHEASAEAVVIRRSRQHAVSYWRSLDNAWFFLSLVHVRNLSYLTIYDIPDT